jgi:glycosyltransferase involved in cell wall biosynthesis
VNRPPLIVLVPAFQEAERVGDVIRRMSAIGEAYEVVVVDDGSADDTSGVARAAGATVLRHPFNLGYGAALQTGYKYALGRDASTVVQMDADGQHDPADVPRLLAAMREEGADLVIGSRFAAESGYHMGRIRTLGRQVFQRIARASGLTVTDPTSGFQAISRPVIELYARDFFPSDYPDVDVLLTAHRRGLRVAEIPVEMAASPRRSTMHGGLRSLYYVYKMLLSLFAAGSRTNQAKL